jgi:hypothetical protein
MKTQNFFLQPFAAGRPALPCTITGTISRHDTRLAISYLLTGPLQDLVIAPPADRPARQWVLWEHTCLELFLAPRNASHYWEFNLSPAGYWNLFRLTNYRQGIQEEPAFQALPFTVHREPGALRLDLEVDLAAIIPADQPLEVGVSAVLQSQDGRLSFWALTHPGPEPDFHHRRGFVIKI